MKTKLLILIIILCLSSCKNKKEETKTIPYNDNEKSTRQLLLEAKCRESGHQLEFVGMANKWLDVHLTLPYIYAGEYGEVKRGEDELDRSYYFKCERCGNIFRYRRDELTTNMRVQVRKKTGIWPRKKNQE
jgi:hypothetical protein